MVIATPQEILTVLHEYNPWWSGRPDPDLPTWKRVAFAELALWTEHPPSRRAVLLSGARQVGKSTLLRQQIQSLIAKGVNADQILYATFDNPLLKLMGLEAILKIWEESRPQNGAPEYLFLDEIQTVPDWQVWLKHQVDFTPRRRIAVTGSAIPLTNESPESGVGRWHTIKLPTLSFYEYLRIRNVSFPDLPATKSFQRLFGLSQRDFTTLAEQAKPLVSHFHDYLMRGGFPETAKIEHVVTAQKLLREDIVDKVLKRDMTALYGVRRILELEKLFLYLCLHDGGILDVSKIGSELGLTRPLINNFIDLLESAHLIYKLHPHGYGKQVLKGQHKVYLADAAISGSVVLRGKSLLQDSTRLGKAVETAVFKHIFTRFYSQSIGFSYWRNKTAGEVDVVAEFGTEAIPFEVKYQATVNLDDMQGLLAFCKMRETDRAYLITRDLGDFGMFKHPASKARILKIPAPIFCFMIAKAELE